MSDSTIPFSVPHAAPRPGSRVEGAIAHASARTGTDFGFMLAQAKVESALDSSAKARTSSASGLFQFIESTWLDVMRRHGEGLGYGDLARQIRAGPQGSSVADPLMRGRILALRNDPQAASLMAGALAQDNRAALRPVLEREPDAGELYLAHFLGSGGASKFLGSMASRPDAPAAAEFARAANANRAIFYTPSGGARSFADVMDVVRGKIHAAMPIANRAPAMAAHVMTSAPMFERAGGSMPFRRPAAAPIQPDAAPASRPLSDMLGESFALGSFGTASAAGDHARRAYERLKAFGL